MIAEHVVDLSRFQFAATALYHFLFVPLTLGMAFILAIMESVYVMTNKPLRFSFGRADREYKERWCNPVPVFKV